MEKRAELHLGEQLDKGRVALHTCSGSKHQCQGAKVRRLSEVETKELQPKPPPELLLDMSASIVSKRPSGDGEEAVFRWNQTRSLLRCVRGLAVPEGPGHLQ